MPRIVYTDISGQERSVPFGPDHPIVTIGRGTDCTIRSNRKSVSRRHAEFRFTNGQYEIIDLNSSNGTFLIIDEDRKPIHGREYLAPNDEVWCGDFILHFIDEEEINTAATPDPFGGFKDAGMANLDFATADPVGAWGGTQPPPPVQIRADHTMERSNDMERLLAEKRSIEDLAARQASELEDLQRKLNDAKRHGTQDRDHTSMAPPPGSGELEQLRDKIARLQDEADDLEAETRQSQNEIQRLSSELDGIREEKRRLEEKLHTSLQSSSRSSESETRLEEARQRIQALEVELESSIDRVSDLETHLSTNANALVDHQKLHEDLLARTRDIQVLESEVDRLQQQCQQFSDELELEQSLRDKGDKAVEETDALRREIERHRRLIEEFDRRNRDLQTEVEELRLERRTSLSQIAEAEERAATLDQDLQETTEAHLQTQCELDALLAEGRVEDLKREIEGLKQRLRLEKERNRTDESTAQELQTTQTKLQALKERNEELNEEVEILREQVQIEPSTVSVEGIPPALLRQLRERVDSLERIVDAIDRTNLDALSTVDRIRLQSAIRDTEPKKSLEHLKELLSGDDD